MRVFTGQTTPPLPLEHEEVTRRHRQAVAILFLAMIPITATWMFRPEQMPAVIPMTTLPFITLWATSSRWLETRSPDFWLIPVYVGCLLGAIGGRVTGGLASELTPIAIVPFLYAGFLGLRGRSIPVAVAALAANFATSNPKIDNIIFVQLTLMGMVTAELLAWTRHRQIEAENKFSEAVERATQDSLTDALTGLGNRRMFENVLAKMADGDTLALIDIDYFKDVNDAGGHEAGDALLIQFARCLRSVTKHSDELARVGGDEIAILLHKADGDTASKIVERLQRHWQEMNPPTTFTAGLATFALGDSAVEVLRTADRALYEAKVSGRNKYKLAERALVTS